MKKNEIEKWLVNRIAREIGLDPAIIDLEAPLINYLMNGVQSWAVVADLERFLTCRLPEWILYERTTIGDLAEYLIQDPPRRRRFLKLSSLVEALAETR